MKHLGDFSAGDDIYIPFNTFNSDGASVTCSNLTATDVFIHKDGDSDTPRNNASGITVSIDFGGVAGNHLVKIETDDETVAGFFVNGSNYQVRLEEITVDGQELNVIVASFNLKSAKNHGANAFPYYLYEDEDEETDPIADCYVWITSDIAGTNVLDDGYTDVAGLVTFYLDSGTYYVWRK